MMKYNNFDILRLIAALQVVFIHTMEHLKINSYMLDEILKFIYYIPGVPIFFLLSGYLITMSYHRNSNLITYTKNRILRIYPALYVNLFLSVLVLYIFGEIEFVSQFFVWLLAQMTFFQFYNIEMFRGFGVGVINGSLWTISVELTFYIILPLIFLLYTKSKKIIIVLILFSFVISLYDAESNRELILNKLLHVSIVPYLFIFMVGIFFYKYKEKLEQYLNSKFFIWLSLYIIFIFLSNFFNFSENIVYLVIGWIIFSFMVFSFAFSFRGLSNSLLKGNDYTYGVYIYHMLIINVFVELKLLNEIKYFVFVYLLSLLLGILSWHLLEKPILGFKKDSLFEELHNDKKGLR